MRVFEKFRLLKHEVQLVHTIVVFLGQFIDLFRIISINTFTSFRKVLIKLVMGLKENPMDSVMLSVHANL